MRFNSALCRADSDRNATKMAKPRAISGCTIIAVAENHATLPQKIDLTMPMGNVGLP